MLDTSAAEVQFALDAVRRGAKVAQQVQATPAIVKTDHSPVTVADFAVQAVVGRLLAHVFPGEALVAEEAATALREDGKKEILDEVTQFVGRVVPEAAPETVCDWIDLGGAEPGHRFWVLDPLDGTKGFLRGGQYAVALALVVDGQVQAGVLGCPNLGADGHPDMSGAGAVVVAVRGQGTWSRPLNEDTEFARLNVSACADPTQACMLRSYESGHTNTAQIDDLVRVLGTNVEPVLMDSQAKCAILAAGVGDLLFRLLSREQPHYREMIWDQAAGSLVIEEAGGRISDLDGKALDFTVGRTLANNRGVVASNGCLHEAALAAVRQVE